MTSPRTLRVLVADDSPLCVDAARRALEEVRGISVVAVAVDGARAVELTRATRPDVVVMDVRMPRMNGLDAVAQIMADCPTPILVLTGDPGARSGDLAYEALRRGALELLAKDDLAVCPAQRAALRARVRFLADVPVVRHLRPRSRWPRRAAVRPRRREVVGLVASTGGPAALAAILGALAPDLDAALLVVQHLSPSFVDGLAAWLDATSAIRVRVARAGDRPAPGVALVAPDGRDLAIDAFGRVELRPPVDPDGHCPSGDTLLTSLADRHGPRAMGVVLTGMGRDGARGLGALRRAGGVTVVQDEASSAVFGMPRAALELDPEHAVLPLSAIADAIGVGAREVPA